MDGVMDTGTIEQRLRDEVTRNLVAKLDAAIVRRMVGSPESPRLFVALSGWNSPVTRGVIRMANEAAAENLRLALRSQALDDVEMPSIVGSGKRVAQWKTERRRR